jgi:hypothetical protein
MIIIGLDPSKICKVTASPRIKIVTAKGVLVMYKNRYAVIKCTVNVNDE